MIALNRYSGAVLRDTGNGATWYALANGIHGALPIGDPGDRLVEIAASLGLLLVITGCIWSGHAMRRHICSGLVQLSGGEI